MTVVSLEESMRELDRLLDKLRSHVETTKQLLRKAVSERDRPDRPAAG